MMGERKACLAVGAVRQAVENGPYLQTAHASTQNDTTPAAERQQFFVSSFLHPGAESAISRRDLMALTGLPDRDLRRLIEAERRQGVPILSDNQRGYFLPATQEERKKCVASLRHRARQILATAANVEKAAGLTRCEQLAGQETLWGGDNDG